MPQDALKIKEKILQTMRINGPSLPVHIAKATGLSILFASAFLSELLSERKIKISHMRVGSSPIYFIPTHEPLLERFSEHLKSKEKETYMVLKEKKFLKDSEQEPAIRVALREIKDFAIPFNNENAVYWRYFTVPEKELKPVGEKQEAEKHFVQPMIEKKTKQDDLNIFEKKLLKDSPKEQRHPQKKHSKRGSAKKASGKKDEMFFNKVREFLSGEGIEITDISGFGKSEIALKVKCNGEEQLLVAYKKKRLAEEDLIRANKKALEFGLKYTIISLGVHPKKLDELIDASKNLLELKRLE